MLNKYIAKLAKKQGYYDNNIDKIQGNYGHKMDKIGLEHAICPV